MERELMYEILTKHFPDFVVKKGEREINGVRKEYVSIRKDGGVAAGIYCDNVGSVDDLVMMIDRIKERYEAAAKESARIAAVISDTLHHGLSAGIAHTESFSCHSGNEGFSGGRAVESHVSHDDVFICLETA